LQGWQHDRRPLSPRVLREREVALKLSSGRWYQGVRPPLQLERAATTGRTGIRSRGPGNLFADFYNKICH
jgi:hypothetical protein